MPILVHRQEQTSQHTANISPALSTLSPRMHCLCKGKYVNTSEPSRSPVMDFANIRMQSDWHGMGISFMASTRTAVGAALCGFQNVNGWPQTFALFGPSLGYSRTVGQRITKSRPYRWIP
ncbi:hypothetical protein SNOG_15181 [Parastagonospora nodorum SN15]|uniref:Uncharacterized protein n=1 Tax=Phaeosphaeria nodorum (strain SN15 / ATCC MYA-4574 / FGSC 10173) TaxID=321614 RepID=Q0TZ49_PHANO|nr:hypothetical protein SNOG_15181 [Parastagonospora nodorum SN15]EAT77406.1 hypothetical protein SNOG_15181 [Parastagonospora nodorum SN15]